MSVKLNSGSNWPRIETALERFSLALGESFDGIDVIALGIHGERLAGLAKISEAPITDEAMEDIRSLVRAYGPFLFQFEEWKEYVEAAFLPPMEQDAIAAQVAAIEVAKMYDVLSPEVSDQLLELAADAKKLPDDPWAIREIVNGLRTCLLRFSYRLVEERALDWSC